MERAAVRRRLTWQFARVVEVATENARTKSVVLDGADWPCQLAGQHVWPAAERPLVYLCGPTGFVEGVAGALVALGHDPSRIRAERFGPT